MDKFTRKISEVTQSMLKGHWMIGSYIVCYC